MRTKNTTVSYCCCLFPVIVAFSCLIIFSDQAWSAWSANPTVNTPICTATSDQERPAIISDGSGWAIIAWEDHRVFADDNIYSQKVNASGVIQWTADGVAISTASGRQLWAHCFWNEVGSAIMLGRCTVTDVSEVEVRGTNLCVACDDGAGMIWMEIVTLCRRYSDGHPSGAC